MMEKEGYIESLPPIYMNLVNIVIDEDPDEALRLIDQAASVAHETSPDREFDIETRRTLAYYRMGNMERFRKGYMAYKEGLKKGFSSVHGRTVEVYHLAQEGLVDEAVKLANEQIDDRYSIMAELYASVGRWEEAFRVQKMDMEESDSINSLLLSSSLQGVQTELKRYEDERNEARRNLYTVLAIAVLLLMLVVALFYIVEIRRRHLREMRKAYERALESDKMKTAFIQNVSHEVRTPLNVISGFAQVLDDQETKLSPEKYRYMADQVIHNANRITLMLNEVLAMSLQESAAEQDLVTIRCNQFMRNLVLSFHLGAEKSRDLTLCFDSELADDFVVKSHESILRLIINQLIDNAVKNTDKGSVTLKLSTTDSELVMAIEDTGHGIAPNDAERIFDRFVKLNDFQEGLGIGLTSSRMMARRIGGDVVFDQTYPGPGSRFVFTVPLIVIQTHS
jgi:signal transduction histidine kinase